MELEVQFWRTVSANPILGAVSWLLASPELFTVSMASVITSLTGFLPPRTSNFRSLLPKFASHALRTVVDRLAVTFQGSLSSINGQIGKSRVRRRHLLDNQRVPWDLLAALTVSSLTSQVGAA